MTTENSIVRSTELQHIHDELERIEALSMCLVSMSTGYSLPESVVNVIGDITDEIETLRSRVLINIAVPSISLTPELSLS